MKKKLQKLGLFIFSINFLFVASFGQVYAWETWLSLPVNEMFRKAMQVFDDAMMVALKKMAVKLVMDRVRALILGQSGGGSKIIADYEDYIYGHSERVARGATRDFFSSVNQSVSSTTRSMYKDIEKTLTNEISSSFDDLKPDMDDYLPSGTKDMFNGAKGGGSSAFYRFLTNDANNAVGMRLEMQSRIDALKERTRDKQRTEILAGGGTEAQKDANGLITLPGKIVSDIQSFVETMELRSLVNSQKLAEVVGGTAAMMVTQMLQSGINKTMQPVDNQLKGINKSVKGGVDKAQKNIYKGIEFDGK